MKYDSSKIEVLEGLEAIRQRPAMYVGQLDDPALFNRLIQEAMCLAIDEILSSNGSQIKVSVFADGSVCVRDNGRGISMTPNDRGEILAEDLFSKLYACRNHKANSELKKSCCEMGIAVVNALSEWFRVRNFREGVCWVQEYRYGKPLAPFRREQETAETGLELSFLPDPSLLSDLHFDADKLVHWVNGIEAEFGSPSVIEGRHGGVILLFETLR